MKIDKPEVSGLIALFIGIGLLAFTFLNAYWLLKEDIAIVGTQDLVGAFGEALAPLIATCIHVMYLGIMGWIGSLLTLRGIPLLTYPKTVAAQATPSPAPKPVQPQTVPVKKEEKAKEKPKQEKPVEKPQPPEKPEAKPKEEPKKEPEKEPEKKPEPEITIEVRAPEEVAVETPQKPSPPSPQQSAQN